MKTNDTTTDDTTNPAADQAAEDAAFDSGYQGNNAKSQKADKADPDTLDADESQDPAPAAAKEPKEPAAAAPAEPPVEEDPFAGLSPAVRDALAKVTVLDHEVRTANGRIAALQRKIDASAKAPAPAPAPATPSVREALRGELPEVAEALNELESRLHKQTPAEPTAPAEPDQSATEQAVAREMQTLTELHPEWQKTTNGTDFALWLSSQGQQFADKVRSTSSAAVVADALTKFDAARARSAQAAAAAAAALTSRTNRVAAAAGLPRGGSTPGEDNTTPEDEEERAMADGFKAR